MPAGGSFRAVGLISGLALVAGPFFWARPGPAPVGPGRR